MRFCTLRDKRANVINRLRERGKARALFQQQDDATESASSSVFIPLGEDKIDKGLLSGHVNEKGEVSAKSVVAKRLSFSAAVVQREGEAVPMPSTSNPFLFSLFSSLPTPTETEREREQLVDQAIAKRKKESSALVRKHMSQPSKEKVPSKRARHLDPDKQTDGTPSSLHM